MRKLMFRCVIAALLAAAGARPAAAGPAPSPDQWLQRLFQATSFDSAWFTPEDLRVASAGQLHNALQGLTDKYGPFQRVAVYPSGRMIRFAHALVPVTITFDGAGRIDVLTFKPGIPLFVSADDVRAAFAALPGRVSLLVRRDGKAVIDLNSSRPMEVGSSFKLAVLAATADAVKAGRLGWGRTVALKESWRAPPTGILVRWPDGALVTVDTLADLMISQSDNMAADALMDLVGRDRVEAVAPQDRPFLTPREYFILDTYPEADLRRAYLGAGEAGRRTLLAGLASLPAPQAGELIDTPTPQLGWRFSAADLCTLLDRVHSLPAMRINPGLAAAGDWREVAFKGGEDPGTFNLSTRVEAADGAATCAVATWNGDTRNPGPAFMNDYMALIEWIHDH